MPTTDDEIQEKYLERAIRELNQLTHRLQECSHCPRGNLMPVLGSGHPQADIFLFKYAPTAAEIEEGVAFYGRAGNALRKSFKRLNIDPLVVYGTLCVKCPSRIRAWRRASASSASPRSSRSCSRGSSWSWAPSALETLNEVGVPLAQPLEPELGADPAAHAHGRGALRAGHRRVARLRGVQARVLDRVPLARRVVSELPPY